MSFPSQTVGAAQFVRTKTYSKDSDFRKAKEEEI
jgi:hypothetical protein